MCMDGTFEKKGSRSGKRDWGKESINNLKKVLLDIYFLSEERWKVKVKGNDVGEYR